jgi:hypothetical protein
MDFGIKLQSIGLIFYFSLAENGPGYTQAGIPENNLFIPFHQNSAGSKRLTWRSPGFC